MKDNKLLFFSLVMMIIGIVCMGINYFILPFPDMLVRVIGVIVLISLFIFGFSMGRSNKTRN